MPADTVFVFDAAFGLSSLTAFDVFAVEGNLEALIHLTGD
jgi:hypothetical protein